MVLPVGVTTKFAGGVGTLGTVYVTLAVAGLVPAVLSASTLQYRTCPYGRLLSTYSSVEFGMLCNSGVHVMLS